MHELGHQALDRLAPCDHVLQGGRPCILNAGHDGGHLDTRHMNACTDTLDGHRCVNRSGHDLTVPIFERAHVHYGGGPYGDELSSDGRPPATYWLGRSSDIHAYAVRNHAAVVARHGKIDDATKSITVKLPTALVADLDALGRHRAVGRGLLIERAIRDLIDRLTGKGPTE